MSFKIQDKYTVFTDIDGNPLESGYIYIGTAGLNPEVSPITVYIDKAQTIPIAQPLRTQGGRIYNNGTPVNVYVTSDYSILVQNKNQTQIYVSLDGNNDEVYGNGIATMDGLIGFSGADNGDAVEVYGYYSAKDGAGGTFIWDSTQVRTEANAGTIVDPTVSLTNQGTGTGSGCWIRSYAEDINVKWFGAKGDDTNDDTAAIQNAIDFIGSGTLFFPKGTYKTTDTISTASPNSVKLLGSLTYGGTTIKAYHTNDAVLFGYICEMQGFSIARESSFEAAAIAAGATAVSMGESIATNAGAAYSRFESIVTNGGHYYGFKLTSSHMIATNITANNCRIGVRLVGANITLQTSAFENNSDIGIFINGCNQARVLNNYLDGNCSTFDYGGGTAIDTDGFSSLYGAIVTDSTYGTFSGNHFNSNNGAAKFLLTGTGARDNYFENFDIFFEVTAANHGATYKLRNAGTNTFTMGDTDITANNKAPMYFLGTFEKQRTTNYPYVSDGNLGNLVKLDCTPYTEYVRSTSCHVRVGDMAPSTNYGFGIFGGEIGPQSNSINITRLDKHTWLRSAQLSISGAGVSAPYDISLQIYDQGSNTATTIANWTGDAQFGNYNLTEGATLTAANFGYLANLPSGTAFKYNYRLLNNLASTAPNVSIALTHNY